MGNVNLEHSAILSESRTGIQTVFNFQTQIQVIPFITLTTCLSNSIYEYNLSNNCRCGIIRIPSIYAHIWFESLVYYHLNKESIWKSWLQMSIRWLWTAVKRLFNNLFSIGKKRQVKESIDDYFRLWLWEIKSIGIVSLVWRKRPLLMPAWWPLAVAGRQ